MKSVDETLNLMIGNLISADSNCTKEEILDNIEKLQFLQNNRDTKDFLSEHQKKIIKESILFLKRDLQNFYN